MIGTDVDDDDDDQERLRYLLKISAKPGAVAVTANSRLIVGSTRGILVMFNLNLLAPSQGNETSTGSPASKRYNYHNQVAFSRTQRQELQQLLG